MATNSNNIVTNLDYVFQSEEVVSMPQSNWLLWCQTTVAFVPSLMETLVHVIIPNTALQ